MSFLINDLPSERSIKDEYPITSAPSSIKHAAHSRLDLPVVITSSTTKIFLFFTEKPLLNSKI